MIVRRQLPVHSPISASALLPAMRSALSRSGADHEWLSTHLATTLGASRVVLTDSGTSALVLALRMVAGEGRTVALPAYTCVDVAAAAVHARVNVRLYDIDPATLSPDIESVARALAQGVDAVVVTHLYGFPADMRAVTELADRHGVPVIEDAAQAAGGTLRDAPLGSLGALCVLSFGRGKGTTGGSGGALLVLAPERVANAGRALVPDRIRQGWRDLAVATAQWMLGRPGLYALPSAVPGLHLGETIYRPAREPDSISAAASTLVRRALSRADGEAAIRRRNASLLIEVVGSSPEVRPIRAVEGGASGFLRFPVLASRNREAEPRLGIVRGYPRSLVEQPELRPWLRAPIDELPGAAESSRGLFTLPVHSLVTASDLSELQTWLRSDVARPSQGVPALA